MTAFDDARTNLEAAVAEARTALSNQDQATQLNLAFGRLNELRTSVAEWVKAFTSLQAIMAANEREFDLAINQDAVKALRADAQVFMERLADTRRLLVRLAERARTQ